jgi:hypothetical protein
LGVPAGEGAAIDGESSDEAFISWLS